MRNVEVNINGLPLNDVTKVDYDVKQDCMIFTLKDGEIIKIHMRDM